MQGVGRTKVLAKGGIISGDAPRVKASVKETNDAVRSGRLTTCHGLQVTPCRKTDQGVPFNCRELSTKPIKDEVVADPVKR